MRKRLLGWLKNIATSNRAGNQSPVVTQDELHSRKITGNLNEDLQQLKAIFDQCSDVVFRELKIGGTQQGVLILLDGLVNTDVIDSDVIKPLLDYGETLFRQSSLPLTEMKDLVQDQVLYTSQMSNGEKIQEVVDHVLSGDTTLLLDGVKQALFISAKGWETRSVEEPATEAVIRGPREGFTENLRTNTSLLRRRLKTPQLKMEPLKVGQLSKTDIVITYLAGIAEESLLEEVRERINRIDIDAILESSYIEELIQDNPYSVFPQVMNTERPDKMAGCLLEGQIGIIIDNTPFALILPVTFYQMLNAAEDYYQPYFISSMIRWLRMMFVIVALFLPSIYIAVTTFHQEMVPTVLLLSIASSRETVPFPAFIEALLMEISFEALREAGVRLPRPVGQAVSIVGALVIGQAAVQAGIVSASMVIIVSITGIASFIFPTFTQGITIRMLRFPMMILAATLGLYGIFLGTLFLLFHMLRLRSFGVPYLSPMAPIHVEGLKDILVRMPRWGKSKRPEETGKKNRQRMKNSLRPGPPSRSK